MDFSWITSAEGLVALLTLTLLELVLGIDNIVFISILTSKLPAAQQARARFIGLALAMAGRIGLLLSISWIMSLNATWFVVFSEEISGRDAIITFQKAISISRWPFPCSSNCSTFGCAKCSPRSSQATGNMPAARIARLGNPIGVFEELGREVT